MSMNVSFSNPDIYAQRYASQNGISVDKAKSELKSNTVPRQDTRVQNQELHLQTIIPLLAQL